MTSGIDAATGRRGFLGMVAGTGLLATGAQAEPPKVQPLPLDLMFSARIEVGKPVEQGLVDGRRQRFIPITGGTVSGPKLNGVVLPGGGDWQTILPGGLTQIMARYALQAEDGTRCAHGHGRNCRTPVKRGGCRSFALLFPHHTRFRSGERTL